MVEVTCRTLQSRFLLRPNEAVNEIVAGVLGRAQRKYPIRVCAYSFVSNHFHLILDVDYALQLSRFMRYVNSNLARKIGMILPALLKTRAVYKAMAWMPGGGAASFERFENRGG